MYICNVKRSSVDKIGRYTPTEIDYSRILKNSCFPKFVLPKLLLHFPLTQNAISLSQVLVHELDLLTLKKCVYPNLETTSL